MKFSKLLVLSALWLGIASNAKAADLTGDWTMPEPTGLEFTTFTDDGTSYYLYSPAARMFFSSGNSWNTQASVRTFGYPFWVVSSSEDGAPEGSYELWNTVNNPDRTDVTGDHNLFTDDGGSTWVDHASQANYSWTFEIVNGCVRFQNVALIAAKPEYEGKYIGFTGKYDGDKNSSVLRMLDPEAEGVSVDWKAVTVASYTAFAESDAYQTYVNGVAAFFSAIKLKAAIEAAEPLYVDVTEAVALYNNPATTAEEMDAVTKTLTELTELKSTLKTKIEDAEAQGFTETAAYRAVLTNTAATKDEISQAIADLTAALVEWGKTHATWDNPADMTGKITNPNFDNASYSGWLGTAPNMTGSGSHGPANVAEKWNDTFDTYQEIVGLPVGVYALKAKTSWRGSWNDMENNVGPAAKLYAKAGELEMSTPFNYIWGCYNTTPLGGSTYFGTSAAENSEEHENAEGTPTTYYSPNDPSAFRLYEEAGFYDTKVLFGVSVDTVRIGVKNPAKLGDADNWSCFDSFELIYYGNGADACGAYLTEALKNFSEYEIEDGTLYTAAYLAAYQQAYQGEKTASSMAEVDAILNGINNAKLALDNNIKLWKKYVAILEKGRKDYQTNPEYEGIEQLDSLADYLEFDSEEILETLALTNEELEAEIAKIQGWMDDIDRISKDNVWDGKNMTKYIKNPGFDEDEDINSGAAEGWTIDSGSGGNITRGPLGQGNKDLMINALGEMNYCFEAWHRYNWDVWQEVKDLPKGMYELQVQGYVRCEVGGYNRGDDIEPDYPSPVKLYMNKAESKFPSVYSECPADYGKEMVQVEDWYQEEVNGNYYPNSMGGAAQCFGFGMYKTTAYGLIAQKGDVFRIGVKMTGTQDWWCIWDSFKLTYRTPTVELVKPLLEAQIEKVEAFEGQPMTKTAKAKLDAALGTAKEVVNGEDGQAMFDALGGLYDITADVEEAIALCEPLQKAIEKLLEDATGSYASSKFAGAASQLGLDYQGKLMGCELEAEDIEPALIQVKAMSTKLRLPEGYENASDNDPVEVTSVIMSPSFYDDENYENTSEGWTNPGNLGNDDEQKGAEAMEFWQVAFDMYQDIYGLPKGTYVLQVDAWVRMGDNTENYNAFTQNNDTTMAYVYGVGAGETYSAPVANLMKADLTEDYGYAGTEVATLGGVDYYLPNSLAGGRSIMDSADGAYTNSVVVKVGDDGILRIGIKKAEEKTNSWVVLDNFNLIYHGENSGLQPGDDPSGIDNMISAPAKKVEYYSLDGRRLNGAMKGITIQKTTLANGVIVVKKIRK